MGPTLSILGLKIGPKLLINAKALMSGYESMPPIFNPLGPISTFAPNRNAGFGVEH
jgi:hypothetical protein